MKEAEKAPIETPFRQRRLKSFAILNNGSVKKPLTCSEEKIKYYTAVQKMYNVIDAVHRAVGHNERDIVLAEPSSKYDNFTKQMINLYLSMRVTCPFYILKCSKCHVDPIDFHTDPIRKFKLIMVYQGHLHKFVLLPFQLYF